MTEYTGAEEGPFVKGWWRSVTIWVLLISSVVKLAGLFITIDFGEEKINELAGGLAVIVPLVVGVVVDGVLAFRRWRGGTQKPLAVMPSKVN